MVTTLTVLVSMLAAGVDYAVAQQMEEGQRDRVVAAGSGKVHVLPATLETTQWDGSIPGAAEAHRGLRRHRDRGG